MRSNLSDALGRQLRDLRISVTDRCNFRCPYCMPAEVYGDRYEFLPRSQILSFEEIERLAGLFAGLGAVKLRLTGGEPLVRAHLSRLVKGLAAIPGVEDLALTTNGVLLAGMAAELAEAGLDRVTVSLDTLDDDVFRLMSGRDSVGPETVVAAIDVAAAAGLTPVKINCVVQRGVNDHTLVGLARRFQGTGHILRFIEFMDVGTLNGWDLTQVVTAAEIVERIDAELPLEPVEPNYRGEVASRYRYRDGSGEIGVIASVSQPFCGDCTRARLSTEGRLVTCLFAAGGVDLRGPMRAGASDEDLTAIIRSTWAARTDRYSEERSAQTVAGHKRRRIEMFQIGG
ncbi:MAG: GTP 3',8-cyclase MoaA [Actinomycetota bacterium]|nr:GTP 3',8-cyclase MoaA [Actinomycetota bacterium]